MTALALLALLSAPLPAARAETGGNDLCHATGQTSGCLGTIERPTAERPVRERPECDAACRQQARDDDAYADAHIVEPKELPLPGPTELRERRTLASATAADGRRDAMLAGAGLLVLGLPEDSPLWLVGLGGIFAAKQLLSFPSVRLQGVPSIRDSLVSLEHARTRLTLASGPVPPSEHDRELGNDPAHGGEYNPEEAATGRRVEEVVGPLTRDPSGAAEWLDKDGRTYDALGPVPSEHFDPKEVGESLDRHLHGKSVDRVPIDVTGLTPEQQDEVRRLVDSLSPADKARVIVVGGS